MTGFELLKSLNGRVKTVHMACDSDFGIYPFGTYRIEKDKMICLEGKSPHVFELPVEKHQFIAPGVLAVLYKPVKHRVPQKLIDQFEPECILRASNDSISTNAAVTD